MARPDDATDDADAQRVPTTDDGEPDHERMLTDMGLQDVSSRSPVYVTDGGDVSAVIRARTGRGEVVLVRAGKPTAHAARSLAIEDLYRDWLRDDLTFVERRFLDADECVLREQVVAELLGASRKVLEDLYDDAEGDAARDLVDAIDAASVAMDDNIGVETIADAFPAEQEEGREMPALDDYDRYPFDEGDWVWVDWSEGMSERDTLRGEVTDLSASGREAIVTVTVYDESDWPNGRRYDAAPEWITGFAEEP